MMSFGRQILAFGALLALGVGSAACGSGSSGAGGSGGGTFTNTGTTSGNGGSGGGDQTCADPCKGTEKCCGGTCSDLKTDVHHCGDCDVDCGDPQHGSVACVDGQCKLTCVAGYGDCNIFLGDGCETDLTQTATDCGSCGAACLVANGTPACVSSKCTIDTCDVGFEDCDSTYDNGCETDLGNDPNNCAVCGGVCTGTMNQQAACSLSVCGNGDCVLGFADCNLDSSDGCEADLLNDPNTCGACGAACPPLPNATGTCNGGACAISACATGFDDCNKSVFDGCESDLSTDPNNCSACGNVCAAVANGFPACVGSACVIGGCDNGYADCDGDPSNGCEANLAVDAMNCGACKNQCPQVANGTPVCGGFQCGIGTCGGTFRDCFGGSADGCETDISSSVDHCGDCATVCPPVDHGSRGCSNSSCNIAACQPGFLDCNSMVNDGCEVNKLTDVNNCGSCGNICPTPANGTASCVNGACGIGACDAGYANCNSNTGDGCEKDTATDPTSCGGCGITCGSGSCVNSACVCNKTVLLIRDDSTTGSTTLATALTAAGYTVTQTAVPSYQYNGTNPAIAGFGTIVLLAGGPGNTSGTTDMPAAGQTAIVNAVAAGNGLVLSEWAAFQVANGRWQTLAPLVLLTRTNTYNGTVNYNVAPGFSTHPIWAGMPAGFPLASSSNNGFAKLGAGIKTVATSPEANDVVAIRDVPVGRVVHVAHSGNYNAGNWTNVNIQKLMSNSVGWVARCQ